jgi:hypothetical protein
MARVVGLLLVVALLVGCHGPRLPQAPNLYVQGDDMAFCDVSPGLQTAAAEILRQ